MSLPKNCLYTNSIESSYSRNYNNNIAPQNGMGPYNVGETIIVNIPTGRNLVMSGADSLLKFGLTATATATACNYVRLDKAGAHSLIQRVRVFHGSTLLSDIDNYNNLVGMMMALQQSGDSAKGKMSILAGIECRDVTEVATVTTTDAMTVPIIAGERLNDYVQLASNATTTKRHYTIPIMNFLTYSDKYIPLFAMTGAPLRLEIQLVSDYKQAINSTVALSSISVTDVEYICNFMEISDSGMSTIQGALGGGPLKWVVQDYRNYSNTAAIDASRELSVPIPSKFNSLRSLFVSFRSKSAGAITFFPLASDHFNLESYTFRLGSKTVPTRAPSCIAEFFGEAIRAIGCVSDLNHEPNINMDIYNVAIPIANAETAICAAGTTASDCFYVGLDLESYSNSGMSNVYQGYNSSTDDIFFTPRYKSTAPAVVARIDTYAYFDQVVVIENGFCSVQF
jgi:hypothetical protein